MKTINLNFISERRQMLKITLQEMAQELGFKNASTYLKYETGEYLFKANHLPIIAKKLRCTINQLFFESNFAILAKDTSA